MDTTETNVYTVYRNCRVRVPMLVRPMATFGLYFFKTTTLSPKPQHSPPKPNQTKPKHYNQWRGAQGADIAAGRKAIDSKNREMRR